mmetsp:Transcript_24084/g.82360  ORF Transcript_24084/g.82360 Transcript_24084/m.82360 type:complete len:403 (-) Transcript_24084:588-1796(-)
MRRLGRQQRPRRLRHGGDLEQSVEGQARAADLVDGHARVDAALGLGCLRVDGTGFCRVGRRFGFGPGLDDLHEGPEHVWALAEGLCHVGLRREEADEARGADPRVRGHRLRQRRRQSLAVEARRFRVHGQIHEARLLRGHGFPLGVHFRDFFHNFRGKVKRRGAEAVQNLFDREAQRDVGRIRQQLEQEAADSVLAAGQHGDGAVAEAGAPLDAAADELCKGDDFWAVGFGHVRHSRRQRRRDGRRAVTQVPLHSLVLRRLVVRRLVIRRLDVRCIDVRRLGRRSGAVGGRRVVAARVLAADHQQALQHAHAVLQLLAGRGTGVGGFVRQGVREFDELLGAGGEDRFRQARGVGIACSVEHLQGQQPDITLWGARRHREERRRAARRNELQRGASARDAAAL